MRIAVIANTSWYLFNFRLSLMRSLQKEGHDVFAVAPTDGYAAQIFDSGIAVENIVISGSGTNPLKEIRSVIELWKFLRRENIDLVLSYTPKGNLYSGIACITLGIPFLPNVSGLGRAFVTRSPVTIISKILYRLTFRRAHTVFFQNQDDMNIFTSHGFVRIDHAIRVPGSGVDLQRFLPAPMSSGHSSSVNFLLVARLLWDKGVGEYVQAARRVKQKYPDARFRLLGAIDAANPSAISKSQIEEWVKEGAIDYLGHTDDVRPILAMSDCVVLPSKYREGVPRTLLEAAASARPIITTDAPGCRDAVMNGVSGYLCQPADVADLTDKMLLFIALSPEDRTKMGRRGRLMMEQNFDERIVIESYLKALTKVGAR